MIRATMSRRREMLGSKTRASSWSMISVAFLLLVTHINSFSERTSAWEAKAGDDIGDSSKTSSSTNKALAVGIGVYDKHDSGIEQRLNADKGKGNGNGNGNGKVVEDLVNVAASAHGGALPTFSSLIAVSTQLHSAVSGRV